MNCLYLSAPTNFPSIWKFGSDLIALSSSSIRYLKPETLCFLSEELEIIKLIQSYYIDLVEVFLRDFAFLAELRFQVIPQKVEINEADMFPVDLCGGPVRDTRL